MSIQAKMPDGTILKFPDGITQEMMDSAVQEHLDSVSKSNNSDQGFLSGAKGTAAAVGDIAAGMLKVPARAALAVGGKVADPSRSLQDTWDTAGQAIEETYPSFGKNMENNPGYTVPMKPFELYGQGAEWLAEHASMGNKDVQGAINVGANFLPIPFVKPAGRMLRKGLEAIDPGLRNVQPNIPKPNIEALKPGVPSALTPDGWEFKSDPNVIDGRYVRAELPETPFKVDTIDPGTLAADSILARKPLEKPLEVMDPGQAEILGALKNEVGDEFIASHDAGAVENVLNARDAAADIQKRGQMESLWYGREDSIEQRATQRLAREDQTAFLEDLQDQLSVERTSKGQKAKSNARRVSPDLKAATANLLDAIAERVGTKQNMMPGEPLEKAMRDFARSLFDAGHTVYADAVKEAKRILGDKWEQSRDAFSKAYLGLTQQSNENFSREPSGTGMGEPPKPIPVPKDTIEHPRTPETITKKNEIRTKVEASSLLKKIAPEYSSVTTPEEAISLAAKSEDINKNPARDVTISGINGQVFIHRKNPVLNFVRYAVQEWRNTTTKFSRDFITSKEGVATLMGKLSKNELIQVMETLREAGKAKLEITSENIGKLGLSEASNKFILSVRKALDAQWEMAADSLQMAGRDAFKPRAGYFPSVASGAYKSLVGVMQDGVFVTKKIAQADTRWDHNKLIEIYKKQLGENAVVVPMGRQGMHKKGVTNNLFNGFNDVINTIAKHDPRFAELQQVAQMKLNEAHHKLKNFDVHEMHKKGIEGFTGDSPARTRLQNAQDMSKALINFLEQGAEYYSGQKALNNIAQVTTSPEAAHLTNTRGVVEQYLKHVLGQDLNPVGNAINWVVDMPFRAVGISHKIPLAAARGLRTAVGLHMMGLWNPTFTALQLTQVLTGAWPRMQDLAGKLDLSAEANKSAMTAPSQLMVLATSKRMGKPAPDFIPEHMKEAFQYALDHGITEFSELEVATSATRNKKVVEAEKLAAIPIVLGERGTRPPVFMVFADIFHKAGLTNSEAFMAAHHATNMSMGDYHPYERPQIYSQLGVLGEFGGALTTYKHNALTNYWSHGKNMISPDLQGNRHLLPAVTALAGVALFQGLQGAPGYEEMDAIFQWATKSLGKRQSIAQAGLESAPDWLNHGVLSGVTGLDFQSRASMANVLPDIAGSSLSPQLSVLADVGMKLYDYNKYRDQHSFNDLMMSLTPSGSKGMTESALLTNEQGQVTNTAGELMFNELRTSRQQTARKWFGIRPLNETVNKNDIYVTSKSLKEREDKESDYALRFRQAFSTGDQKGMEALSQKYLEMGGDPQVLFNSQEIQQALERASVDQRTRMAGQLAATQKSLRRWQELHPGGK